MSDLPLRPHVTVAAIAQRDGRFLLVEEHVDDGALRINQPAGHVEAGESLVAAVAREALEETGHQFAPDALVGVYHWRADNGTTYLRFAFAGVAQAPTQPVALDAGIVRALWLTPQELAADRTRHRSPLVARCITDYLRGQRFPLEMVYTLL